MTRLKTTDVNDIEHSLFEYDNKLKQICGCSLWEIACQAAGLNIEDLAVIKNSAYKIHIIPVNNGLGIISGFTESLKSIISHLGFPVILSDTTDVTGLSQAIEKKADLVFMADDDRFVIFDLKNRSIIDNTPMTALGYVTALDLMVKSIHSKSVLILGCGPVGIAAAKEVIRLEGQVSVFDTDPSKSEVLKKLIQKPEGTEINVEADFRKALKNHQLIVDATPAADIIDIADFQSDTYIVAPGVPCGITKAALVQYPDQILHDPLQLGVATMLAQSLNKTDL
jgi:3-methylornithyl-N6-L-lysine dehydrogenase